MKFRGTSLLAAAILVGALSTQAEAYDPFIDWGPLESFAYEPNFVLPHQSIAGNPLTIVGKVDAGFFGPLAGNTLGPGVEYTFVIDQLTSQGGVNIANIQWQTNYTGGAFRFYKDTTPDRNYGTNPPNATAPSSFEDGELILSGTLSSFKTVSNTGNNGGNYNANVKYTGGTQLHLLNLCPDANGNHGRLIGVWQRGVSGTPAGYIRSCDGKFDLWECPVPTENSTWGRIKSLIQN